MRFVKKIREELGLNPYQMSKEMGIEAVGTYQAFENSTQSLNALKLIRLWKVSGLSAEEFLSRIEREVNPKKRRGRRQRSSVQASR